MKYIVDLHVHSRFSRACSKDLTLENNARACTKKGVNILGTGDFTHPTWFAEIEDRLELAEEGLYRLRSGESSDIRFVITSEVSQIYKRGGKTRRIHNLLFAPSIEVAKKVNAWMEGRNFNLRSDGRPILGLDSEDLYRELKNIDSRIVLAPAHVWTPWFALFGSKSGFDSLEECFGEMSQEVFAIETGLSSDPLMNRAWSALDRLALISNSDAHSPQNFGREANVFEIPESEISFSSLMDALRTQDRGRFLHTIEFFPEEGKYHIDGHAACGFSCSPEETRRLGGKCPKCGQMITVGVMARVAQLADRSIEEKMPERFTPFRSIVPLPEVLAESVGVRSVSSPKVQKLLSKATSEVGSEFYVLLDAPLSDVRAIIGERAAEAISRVREGKFCITPGYDGVYGRVAIFGDEERDTHRPQASLF